MSDKFYITTTLPYVNANPHVGFALEIVAADVIARYQALLGKKVIFNTGTDEHGQKIYEKALENGMTPLEYCTQNAQNFKNLIPLLNLSVTNFIRTTDPNHIKAAQAFWLKCQENDDIYKRLYQITYCVGCELEKQASDLEDGKCPLHPHLELEIREEENYFFRFSKYEQELLNLYENQPDFVKPEGKMTEIYSFVKSGLNDFSISRLKAKMPWGISVPGDSEHVMYVWFDALVNYISTLGWPDDLQNFSDFWPGVQIAGKDNLRQQSAMWQAMLMSAGITPSKQVLINGFINVDGQKISKSLGNVIAPEDMVERYGREGTRYLLMNLGPIGEDMDINFEKLDKTYTADLSNGLGNLCSRVAKLCEKFETDFLLKTPTHETHAQFIADSGEQKTTTTNFHHAMSSFELSKALELLFLPTESNDSEAVLSASVADLDKELAKTKPWQLPAEEARVVLEEIVRHILDIAVKLEPFMPETSKTIINHFTQKKITALSPLFPRL